MTMTATLASYFSVLWLEHLAHLRVDAVVLAVVLAVTLARPLRRADLTDRAIGLVLFPVVTVGASGIGMLLPGVLGSALFVLAVSATIWIRRWGPRFTTAGALATAPLLATLILPAVPGRSPVLWTAVVAVIAYAWASVLVRRRPPEPRASSPRISTRMAVQMGVALAASFAAGHVVFGTHWSWVVLTAFVVCSANRGRGDVLRKGMLRVAGAAAGTGVATVLTGLLTPANPWQVVAIFVLLAAGIWLRPVSYAYWAGCVTAALAFLYGYFGEAGTSLLLTRLGGVVLGGLIGAAASWFVLPVRGRDDPAATVRAWLARVHAMVRRVLSR
ncbi:FUSC family protein [Actinophytocola sp.]|uniref:FUSC family protein n=1 Tax=Actinophytocola sp. TaxID=1872138 RepID=UPI002ED15EE8